MKNDLIIKNGIVIPEHEIEITASRGGGPGGQHVNKTSTRITLHWNVKNTNSLNDEQKDRVLKKLQAQLTIDGELVIHNNTTRSQLQNKKLALEHLAEKIRNALYVPKKRIATKVPKKIKEARLQEKKYRSSIKKLRNIKSE